MIRGKRPKVNRDLCQPSYLGGSPRDREVVYVNLAPARIERNLGLSTELRVWNLPFAVRGFVKDRALAGVETERVNGGLDTVDIKGVKHAFAPGAEAEAGRLWAGQGGAWMVMHYRCSTSRNWIEEREKVPIIVTV
jgi:hypothetical protein